MNARTLSLAIAVIAVATAAQCTPKNEPTADKSGSSKSPTVSDGSDSSRIARLEREARAIAKTDGCSSAEQCRAAPVGERACGGPRDYIVYCARTTDSTALYRKLAELRQAEIELNKKTGAMSTCEFRMPPEVGVAGGGCRVR